MLRRPDTTWADIVARVPELAELSSEAAEQVTADTKYSGYVDRQQADIARQKKLQRRRIPDDFDYAAIRHLRMEAREKLERVRPRDIAQASRISGITPADLTILAVSLQGIAGDDPSLSVEDGNSETGISD